LLLLDVRTPLLDHSQDTIDAQNIPWRMRRRFVVVELYRELKRVPLRDRFRDANFDSEEL
jgi:hypothetical protein